MSNPVFRGFSTPLKQGSSVEAKSAATKGDVRSIFEVKVLAEDAEAPFASGKGLVTLSQATSEASSSRAQDERPTADPGEPGPRPNVRSLVQMLEQRAQQKAAGQPLKRVPRPTAQSQVTREPWGIAPEKAKPALRYAASRRLIDSATDAGKPSVILPRKPYRESTLRVIAPDVEEAEQKGISLATKSKSVSIASSEGIERLQSGPPVERSSTSTAGVPYYAAIRYDSNITDDGYNDTFPVSSGSEADLERTRLSIPHKLTMYEWAKKETLEGSYGGGPMRSRNRSRYGLDVRAALRGAATGSAAIIRQLPQDKNNREPNSKPVRVFVGSWNTEYSEFSEAELLQPIHLDQHYDPLKNRRKRRSVPEIPTNDLVEALRKCSPVTTGLNLPLTPVSPIKVDPLTNSVFVSSLSDRYEMVRKQDLVRQEDQSAADNDSIAASGSHAGGESSRNRQFSDSEDDSDAEMSQSLTIDHGSRCNADDGPSAACLGSAGSGAGTATGRGSTKRQPKPRCCLPPDGHEPLSDWIPPGYEVYVIALQEAVSSRFFKPIRAYLGRVNGFPYKKMKFSEDKISGLGDGAYLSTKSTIIGCFVAEDVLGPGLPVEVGSSKAMALNLLNGSKGAVAFILKIFGQQFCFISCHLPAGKPKGRIKAREAIRRKLAEAYCGYSSVNPTEMFHHIIWTGDFNLRLQEIRATSVVKHLQDLEYDAAFAYDEFNFPSNCEDMREFEEAPIEFLPTYKKRIHRSPLNLSSPTWPVEQYQIAFKVQWYKGGKVKERVPSWTDRIFKWSLPMLRGCCVFLPKTYLASEPDYPESIFAVSDHSPIGCGFEVFPLDSQYHIPPVFSHDKGEKLKIQQLNMNLRGRSEKEATAVSV